MKIASFISIFLMFAVGAFSQPPAGPPNKEERMTRTMEMLRKETGLSAQQEAKIRPVFNDFFVQQEKLRPAGPPEARDRQAMDRIVQERDMKVKRILEKGQYEKYIRAMSKMRPQKPAGGPPR